jgi:hypothetical protein
MNRLALALLPLTLSVCLGGCANQNASSKKIPPAPSLAIVSSETWVFEWGDEADTSESDLNECLQRELESRNADVVSEADFLGAAFPNLDPATAPRTPEFLELALGHPEVNQRITNLGIEYIVYVTGTVDYENAWVDGGCASQGGCLIVGAVNKTSRLTAVVIDVQSARRFGQTTMDDSGISWAAIIIAIPVWNVADTRGPACADLADEVLLMLHANAGD